MGVFSTSRVIKRAVETTDRVLLPVCKEGTDLLWIGDIYLTGMQGIDKFTKWRSILPFNDKHIRLRCIIKITITRFFYIFGVDYLVLCSRDPIVRFISI
jgi:hypothetical protein